MGSKKKAKRSRPKTTKETRLESEIDKVKRCVEETVWLRKKTPSKYKRYHTTTIAHLRAELGELKKELKEQRRKK